MILPTKGIPPQDALISVGGDVLGLLTESKTVSRLWAEFGEARPSHQVTFDWFVLGIDLLFMLGVVELDRGRLRRAGARLGGGAIS